MVVTRDDDDDDDDYNNRNSKKYNAKHSNSGATALTSWALSNDWNMNSYMRGDELGAVVHQGFRVLLLGVWSGILTYMRPETT